MTGIPSYQRLFAELKRRKVFRVAAVYGGAAFVTIEAADLVFPRIPLPEWTIALVVWLALLGLPLALALAWAYERTPEGLKATDMAMAGELETIAQQPRRRRWPAGIAAAVGITLLALAAWWTLARTGPGARSYDSIAVLPFTDMSGDPENRYFGDGLADELINALANVQDLKVAGRTSSFALRDQNLDLRSIGDTLDVEAVLEGSVRRSEDRVRIMAQLIDAETGFHLWSEEYDRDITDIFMVQEELAQSILRELVPRLGAYAEGVYRGGTSVVRAYELYVAGRQKWYTRRGALLYEAVDDFEEAVALDPGFALGWSGLADAIDALAYRDARAHMLVPRAKMAAQRAVLLDPDLAEAWASWGVLASEVDRDWTTAELALKRAIVLKPSYVYARAMLGDLLRYQGRVKEALEQHRTALALDPLSPVAHGTLAQSLVTARQYAEGRSMFERMLAMGGDNEAGSAAMLQWGPLMGLTGEVMANHAVFLARALGATDPDGAAVIGHALASDGTDEVLFDEARRALGTLIADSRILNVRTIIVLYTNLGDYETALQWVERAADLNDLSFGILGVDPALDPLRSDPRMQRLTDQLGLPNGYDPAADTYEPVNVP
jgi:TolB-like protein/tetratricopeptide (TPR) repeat protein